MKKLLLLFCPILLFFGCEKGNLDGLAFPSERLDSYQFEMYDAGAGAAPSEYDITAENRTLVSMISVDQTTGEEYKIFGVYIGDMATIATDTVLLYCHGQSQHMDVYWPRVSLLSSVSLEQHHYGVFMMDYRSYGMSEGQSSEQGLIEDVDVSIDWLKNHGAAPERTFYYGFSLGCIPVIDRAAYRTDFKPAKVIIEAPLASVSNLAESSLILNVDPSFVSTLEFENAEKIKDVTAPLLWMHGVEDDYIEISNGELIFQNHNGEYKEAIRVEGAGHSSVPSTYGFSKYINSLRNFMQK